MRSILRSLIIVLILLLLSKTHAVHAQDTDIFSGGRYNSSIPTIESMVGHKFGSLHTFHSEMTDFFVAVAAASDRVELYTYGRSYEGRKLFYLVISDPDNMNKMDMIKELNLSLTDPRKTSNSDAEEIAKELPVITWLGYNIHGNESSGMEASMAVVYQLAAGEDAKTLNILKNSVVMIDPIQNPDGRERYAQYMRSVVTTKSHPQNQDAEHRTPWPGGRTNHYLFDLNRDFFLKTQVETQEKTRVFHEFRPHIVVDHHEMGLNSTFMMYPAQDPFNEYMSPLLFKWWDIIAKGNADAFDEFGWGYFVGESYDSYYPGYGESYPSINGSIGTLYEQASANGVSSYRNDGTILTLRESTWHHFTASMATINTASNRREEKVLDFYQFFVDALESVKTEPIKEIILLPGHDPQITAKLIKNMLQEKVEIRVATSEFTNKKSYSYDSKVKLSKTYPAGSYIISLDQPQKVLIKTLLAPNAKIEESFIKEEKQRHENREGTNFYDITAWSMPLTFGIETYYTEEYSKFQSGDNITEPTTTKGNVVDGPAKQAYLIPFEDLASTKLVNELLKGDYKVRVANKSFTLNGKAWDKGTIVVRINRNEESIHSKIEELSNKFGVTVTALNSGLATEGIDLGSNNVRPIKKPKIAVLTDTPTRAYSYGAINYLFEREVEVDFTRLRTRSMSSLKDYNILVMPDGNYNDVLNETQLETFKTWIRDGGTVLAIGGSVKWLISSKISKIESMNGKPDPADKDKKIKIEYTPGVILRVNMNQLSFLSYGVQKSVNVFMRSSNIYSSFADDKFKNIGTFADAEKVKMSGFIWPETEQHLAGNGYLFLERFGRGKVISFAEDPLFRASYDGLLKLFFNAVLLGPSFNQ